MREEIIQPVSVGAIASEFILDEGWTENPATPTDCMTVAMRSQFDTATGQNRKAYKHILKAEPQKQLQKKAKRMLERIQREDAARQRKALRAMFAATSRGPAFYKTF